MRKRRRRIIIIREQKWRWKMSKKRMKVPLVLDSHAIACKHTCKGQNIIINSNNYDFSLIIII